jgi:hypothetical protein
LREQKPLPTPPPAATASLSSLADWAQRITAELRARDAKTALEPTLEELRTELISRARMTSRGT